MIRVGVIRGGVSDGYEASLTSGAFVLQNLPKDRYTPVDIFIDREGVWHLQGRPLSPELLLHRVDVLWNLTNGFYGADGKMHQLFEQLGIPYVGPTPFAAAELAHHGLLRNRLTEKGHKTPRCIYVASWKEDTQAHVAAVVKAAFELVAPPWIVRTISRGHMQGHISCSTREELTAVLLHMADAQVPVVIEETVTGTPVSVMVIPRLRASAQYVTVPHTKNSRRPVPPEYKDAIMQVARTIHSDFELDSHVVISGVVGTHGDVYVTDIDAHPDLSLGSDALHALEHLGISFGEFSDSVLKPLVK